MQIGGGFRVPEILEASGARLREVGTTNRTTLEDYEAALSPQTVLVLRVHRSNFYLGGFAESPDTVALAALTRRRRVPLAEDLGSGAVADTGKLAAIEHERTPAEAIRSGVDAVCFSGDKLLGGPQAGLIAGRARLVAAFKKEPFFRALRCDKLVLAALQATWTSIWPVRQRKQSPRWRCCESLLMYFALAPGKSSPRSTGFPLGARPGAARARVGGGTLPRAELESVTLDFRPPGLPLAEFAARLRAGTPPVVGYVSGDRFRLDLRTVFPRQDDILIRALRAASASL